MFTPFFNVSLFNNYRVSRRVGKSILIKSYNLYVLSVPNLLTRFLAYSLTAARVSPIPPLKYKISLGMGSNILAIALTVCTLKAIASLCS